jgi:hypothetical protein
LFLSTADKRGSMSNTRPAVSVQAPLEAHPLANLFPLLEGPEFDELVADIKEHGLLEPIVTHDGKILDGRNRYRACLASGARPWFKPFDGTDPLVFVVSLNLKRRHLNESQRAMVAAKLATLRLGASQHSEGLPIGRASTLLNVGERSTARAREVLEHGEPELIRAVETGEISVTGAVERIREIINAYGERPILQAASRIHAEHAETRHTERIAKLIAISEGNSTSPCNGKSP